MCVTSFGWNGTDLESKNIVFIIINNQRFKSKKPVF